uniref:Uncharacterized protein n=1 Tax=Ditylenchus dipsaci TaxID=166011 RepID=A0A915EI45_9BILA
MSAAYNLRKRPTAAPAKFESVAKKSRLSQKTPDVNPVCAIHRLPVEIMLVAIAQRCAPYIKEVDLPKLHHSFTFDHCWQSLLRYIPDNQLKHFRSFDNASAMHSSSESLIDSAASRAWIFGDIQQISSH